MSRPNKVTSIAIITDEDPSVPVTMRLSGRDANGQPVVKEKPFTQEEERGLLEKLVGREFARRGAEFDPSLPFTITPRKDMPHA